ncbi:MAG: hypothetical protein GFH27_549279n501 [Chloroflexi bacterium AL-W]|nr:hypothetical protein [Chloroflexi bacterium AL-N1]NOK65466.1 hypothetical protein [Chloroflexi bacterium AL-N10]NOK72268.1 hypothetical protein [Chloroflexi bacterium AL-N5]NOK79646.1 hypothetical protein [Chloroflexi bacterium AL-W]NOK87561.1 hypothetical protein [Chloroflexi bacterium AL-N15]
MAYMNDMDVGDSVLMVLLEILHCNILVKIITAQIMIGERSSETMYAYSMLTRKR